jgi:hypothetical protein
VPVIPEPEIISPNVGPIVRIHRGPDGYVSFGRKLDDDEWQNLPSIKVERLQTMFPAFVQQLMRDSYFSLDTYLTTTRDHKRYLNACWVDIDLHAPGEIHTLGQRYGQILDMVQARRLPRPSLTVYSGRGVWVLWLLVDRAGSDVPPKAFVEKRLAQEAINRRLADLLRADPCGATVQMIRVPGSTNMKTEPGHEVVQYRFLVDLDHNQRSAVYTLDQLAQGLGLELPTMRDSRRLPARSEQSARYLRGWTALNDQRVSAFRQLEKLRNGFGEGCRNRAAYLYGAFLRGYGMDEKSTWAELQRFAANCQPPMSTRQLRSAFFESRKSRGQIRNSTISRYLQVTAEEGKLIPEWAPEKFKGEVKPIDMAYSSHDRINLRKAAIIEIFQELGRWPSCRVLARMLAERGYHISHVQVSKYVKEMQPASMGISGLLPPPERL